MKKLFGQYKHIILYLIFGIITTLVNLVVYFICARIWDLDTVPSTIIAWIIAVAVAYFTNRKWVFESEVTGFLPILLEMGLFFLFRLATGVMDVIIMHVTVDIFEWNELIMKVISNVVVVILNYIFSELLIFRKKGNK